MDRLIDRIILQDQFKIPQMQKNVFMLDIIKGRIAESIQNPNIKSMYEKLGVQMEDISSLDKVPFIPVKMFKKFDLLTCSREDVVRILNSSATTSAVPSRVYLDRTTQRRQSQALLSTLRDFLGKSRRPLLVIDAESSNSHTDKLTARGAAIRGISSFAKTVTYALCSKNGELVLNIPELERFQRENENREILVYGFTYIIWSRFVRQAEKIGLHMNFPQMKLLHSGGWKKLVSKSVKKDEFNRRTASVFGTRDENIKDFYGMVEQLGVVFVDCEYGFKHVPDFAEVIIRDFNTLEEVGPGKKGMIEVMSVLGSSYPSEAILTEDVGELSGIDTCKCGRLGKYFKFKSRVEKAEVRGCGDTFAERDDGV